MFSCKFLEINHITYKYFKHPHIKKKTLKNMIPVQKIRINALNKQLNKIFSFIVGDRNARFKRIPKFQKVDLHTRWVFSHLMAYYYDSIIRRKV